MMSFSSLMSAQLPAAMGEQMGGPSMWDKIGTALMNSSGYQGGGLGGGGMGSAGLRQPRSVRNPVAGMEPAQPDLGALLAMLRQRMGGSGNMLGQLGNF